MNVANTRSVDFNLLPVLVAVAETGSVTAAAAKLYVTQSAVSAALGRLRAALGEPIVIRHGRGVVLTDRGARLVAEARPHLDALLEATLFPSAFDARRAIGRCGSGSRISRTSGCCRRSSASSRQVRRG